jgi:hypothetical protein
MTGSKKTAAAIDGPAWSAGASGWVEHWAGFAAPAREAVARAAGIEAGASVLDVGCGSGEFCELAAARGAGVSGIDAAEGLVEVARRRLPKRTSASVRSRCCPGATRASTWSRASTPFSSPPTSSPPSPGPRGFTRRGGRVAICNSGRIEDREVHAIFAPLREVEPPQPPGIPPYDPPPIGEPGVLEDLTRRVGLASERTDEVEVPYEFPDRATLERALLAFAPILHIGPEVGEQVVRRTVEADAEPFRRSEWLVQVQEPPQVPDRRGPVAFARMRSGLFLPLFDELADPAIVARLPAEAEEAGWHGAFVWDHVRWREPVVDVADPWITLRRSPPRPSASDSGRWSRRLPDDGRSRSPGRPRRSTGSAAAG